MAQTQSVFLTLDQYYADQEKQNTSIRGEFGLQASLIERGNQQLRNDLTDLNTTFNDKLSSVNNALGGRIDRLDNELILVKQDLKHLKGEVGEIKGEVGEIKGEVGEIKARLSRIEGRSFNNSRFLPHHKIAPIGIYNPEIGFKLPNYFPLTINQFWNLQLPSQEKNLISLLQFYDIQGYQQWAQVYDFARDTDKSPSCGSSSQSDASDSDDSLPRDLSIEEAVRRYPHIAMDELGAYIGLQLDRIRDYFHRVARYQGIQPRRTKKRLAVEAPKIEVVKRVKNEEPPPSPIQNAANLLSMAPAKSPTSSPSDRIMWDADTNKQAHADLIAKMYAARSVSTGASKDSTTDIIPSSELRDFGGSKEEPTKEQ